MKYEYSYYSIVYSTSIVVAFYDPFFCLFFFLYYLYIFIIIIIIGIILYYIYYRQVVSYIIYQQNMSCISQLNATTKNQKKNIYITYTPIPYVLLYATSTHYQTHLTTTVLYGKVYYINKIKIIEIFYYNSFEYHRLTTTYTILYTHPTQQHTRIYNMTTQHHNTVLYIYIEIRKLMQVCIRIIYYIVLQEKRRQTTITPQNNK